MDLQPRLSLRARAIALAVVLWAFGLATTTLLVGVWGRSVTSDTSTLTESALAGLDPDTVSDQVADWLLSEAESVPGISESTAETVVGDVVSSAPARVAVESIVADIVEAATAPAGSETVIDVASAIEPIRPVVIASLEGAGVPATPAQVDGFLRQIESLVLTSADRMASTNALSTARSTLTTVMLVGAAGLAVFGLCALWLSEDRTRMLRSLANRLIVSAVTFTLFLRIGAWAVDPRGGRSPLRESGAILLASNSRAVLVVAVAALAVSGVASIGIRRVRNKRRPAIDDPTGTIASSATAAFDPISPESAPQPARTPDPASVR